MGQRLEHLRSPLKSQPNTVDFHAPRSRARATAHHGTHDENRHAERRPQIRVGGGESRGRGDGTHLERGHPESFAEREISLGNQQVGSHTEDSQQDRAQKHFHDFGVENIFPVGSTRPESGKNQAEIDACQQHRDAKDGLDSRTVERRDTDVFRAKAARAASRHGMSESVEPGHARQMQCIR